MLKTQMLILRQNSLSFYTPTFTWVAATYNALVGANERVYVANGGLVFVDMFCVTACPVGLHRDHLRPAVENAWKHGVETNAITLEWKNDELGLARLRVERWHRSLQKITQIVFWLEIKIWE